MATQKRGWLDTLTGVLPTALFSPKRVNAIASAKNARPQSAPAARTAHIARTPLTTSPRSAGYDALYGTQRRTVNTAQRTPRTPRTANRSGVNRAQDLSSRMRRQPNPATNTTTTTIVRKRPVQTASKPQAYSSAFRRTTTSLISTAAQKQMSMLPRSTELPTVRLPSIPAMSSNRRTIRRGRLGAPAASAAVSLHTAPNQVPSHSMRLLTFLHFHSFCVSQLK
eukprot:m.131595 g.131595  ORF g.131595 m.131595 type:complete len:224 (+) comp13918_c2_seq2:165-836(+)